MSENNKIIQENEEINISENLDNVDNNNSNNNVSMSNIFDEFEVSEDVKEKLEEKKDVLYYINFI
jgi:hypothetical protein